MKITTEEFLTNFHNLSGVTIGERRKNLFIYFKNVDPNELDVNFAMVQPKTPLEERFKIDALIYFKRVPELVEVLKCENRQLIRRVVKNNSWFIDEAFKNVTGEELVSILFPQVSLTVKLKIINELSKSLKNTRCADEYFEAIKSKYGLHLASNLLSSCSLEKILVNIKCHKIKFSYCQILKIIKKYPESTEQILDIMKGYSKNFNNEYAALFKYFSRNDLLFFFKLREKYKLQLKVGWRITEKFVRINKEEIIQNHKVFYDIFNKKRIIKTLGYDYSRIFIKLFPTDINDYRHQQGSIFSVFESLPKNMQDINLLLNAFEQVYGSSLLKHPQYITTGILHMLPISEREGILKIENKPEDTSEDEWYCYYKTSISIPYFKKRISLTCERTERSALIGCLVETCSLNDDMEALAQLCEYMVKRHRNDYTSVRNKFFRTMEENFDLRKLEKRHWDSIHELIQIFNMNDQYFTEREEFFTAYVYFCLEHQLPIKETITELIKYNNLGYSLFKDKPEYDKKCFLLTYEIGSEMYDINYTTCRYRTSSFYNSTITAIHHWNSRHPEDVMSFFSFPLLVQFIQNGIKNNDRITDLDRTLMYLLRKQPDHEETQSLLKSYFSMSASFIDTGILNYVIKYLPLIVSEDIENVTKLAIIKSYRRDNYFFWIFSKNYTHLNIPQRMISICIENHQNNHGDRAIAGLSHLMSNDEFLNFIASYYPMTPQADSLTKEGRSLYEIQRLITKYLPNIQPASVILPSILKFCQGDYLKLIIRSLYSASDTTNEDKLAEFFSSFTDNAVSVRKHAMHLSFRLLEQANIFCVLSKFMETEKDSSIRRFLFKGIFKYFVKNPDDKSWELVKLNLNEVDVEDKKALKVLMEVDKIPKLYFLHYIVLTWQFLDKCGDKCRDEKTTLLRKVTPSVFRQLPKEFCEKIISTYFFNTNDNMLTSFQTAIQTFTCQFIIYCDSKLEQEQRLIKYYDIAIEFKNVPCDDHNMQNGRRNCVANFLKMFCLQFIDNGCFDKLILHKFAKLWNKCVHHQEALDEYLHLQFSLIYVENLSMVELGRKISQLYDTLVNFYGVVIVQMFYKYLKFFLKYFYDGHKTEAKRMYLIEGIMDQNHSASTLLLISTMLADDGKPNDIALIEKYNAILDVIRSYPDLTVQVFNTTYLCGTTTLNYY